MTKKSTFIQRAFFALLLMVTTSGLFAQNICDCDGTSHTPGVLVWLGDTYADDGTYTWEGQFVNFNCATWGYDCGDIVGAPADDPYGVCAGNLPPNNGCAGDAIFGCTDVLALNYNMDATVDDGSCVFVEGCTNPLANNYNPAAVVDDGSCTFDLICDCAGTQHTAGVLTWIGDTFADDGTYTWEGQFVDFNCATWGYDCGDIVGAPLDDPYAVCSGNLPPNSGCIVEIFGCTDPLANNYNIDATVDDGSCLYDIAGCTDPLANNYDPFATIEDGSCTYGTCGNFMMEAIQTPCIWDGTALTYSPGVDFTFLFDGGCTVTTFVVNVDGTEYPFAIDAPFNVSGSEFGLSGFPNNAAFSAYYVLSDGTASDVFDYVLNDCANDPLICDCDGNAHTIGVLSWVGDTFADDGTYTWGGQTVSFNCATWGYDCGDIVGAPLDDPYAVCSGNLPPNNGCVVDVFGCTDPLANNYNIDATVDDGTCTYDIAGCTDPLANNYDPFANIEDGSCIYGTCGNFMMDAIQTPCIWDEATQAYYPGANLTFLFDGGCTVASLIINLEGTEYPFVVDAPFNVSGSQFGLSGFPNGASFSAYYVLTDGTASDVFDFVLTDCAEDALICDCDGNAHSIGVLSWLGDTFADDGTYTWGGQTVSFNCATWGYDCGDIVGAPLDDPYAVCSGNLPPNNGCVIEIFGCTDPLANNYNIEATTDDGTCTYDVLGCTDPTASNYNMDATIDDGSCIYSLCSNLVITGEQALCQPDANGVLLPGMDFTVNFDGDCTAQTLVLVFDGVEYPFDIVAPDNVSGSVVSFVGFPENVTFTAYFTLSDGSASLETEFSITSCSQDPVICDCDGNAHTIGVLSWIGDTFGDDGTYTWGGQTVNFNCATWGYDCGDIAGAPAEDPNGVCLGNLPPNNGCSPDIILGCTDATANNYNPAATLSDGSCTYDVLGCTDATASNYNPNANVDDGSCTFDLLGCTDATANNYNAAATVDDGSCTYDVLGCTDPTANNYDADANVNDGSCTYDVLGCTDPTANNYNADATVDDGSCTYDVFGCTDPLANNYNADATIDDGSCNYEACFNLVLTAEQTPCTQDNTGVLNPGVDFTFTLDGAGCTIDSLFIVLDGTVIPFEVTAPDNVSGSVFPLTGFPANSSFSAFYSLSDGTISNVFDFSVGDCSQDAVICDCDQNEHTIGVLSWIGDTFADNGAYTWAGVPVNFNCATWGYDCGDIAGAPAEDPYGVCQGNLPPDNGCGIIAVEEITSMNIEAYPNPTSGMITLVNRGEGGNKQIRVFDQTGKLQFAEQRTMAAGSSEMFNLSALAAGTYHVQVVGNNGVSNITVVVQK
jgi:Secretion system C-terminal sorting domain